MVTDIGLDELLLEEDQAWRMATRIAEIARREDAGELAAGLAELRAFLDDELEVHLDREDIAPRHQQARADGGRVEPAIIDRHAGKSLERHRSARKIAPKDLLAIQVHHAAIVPQDPQDQRVRLEILDRRGRRGHRDPRGRQV